MPRCRAADASSHARTTGLLGMTGEGFDGETGSGLLRTFAVFSPQYSSGQLRSGYTMEIREVRVKTKIRKWGNSLGQRIPRSLASEAEVGDGSTVDITVQGGELVIRPLRRRRYSLDELLAGVDEGNVHGEVSTGRPVGNEGW